MGSGASTKKTVGKSASSARLKADVERPSDEFHKATGNSAEEEDEIDGGPTTATSTASNHKKDSVAQNDEILEKGNTEATSRRPADFSGPQRFDNVASKAKRIQEFSPQVKGHLTNMKLVIDHVQTCADFPCSLCLNMEEVQIVSQNQRIDREAVSDGLAIDTEFCKMFADTWKRRDLLQAIEEADSSEELSAHVGQIFTFFSQLLGSAWNFTDKSDAFCAQFDQDGCLSLLVDWFLLHHESDNSMNKWLKDLSFVGINILNNACRRIPSLSPKHHRVVPALQAFGESDELLTQTIAFITLAKLVKKEEADKLSTNNSCIETLLYLIEKCLCNSNHRVNVPWKTSDEDMSTAGFPAVELVQAIEELAINDNNKKLIVKKRGIPTLGKLLQAKCSTEEKTFAANAIWRLAFLKENKEQLRKHLGIVYDLTENSQSENEKLRNACMGALFEIYESRLPEGLTLRKAEHGSSQRASSESNQSSGHIMLSYKWEHPSKPVMREFKNQLRKRGYNVWMDEDHMMGDKIGAMAEAVENADMVIACITRGYQDSQDCRTEATYAYDCKKKIIPVKVSNDFKATGWLGGITAGKIYYFVGGTDYVSKVLPTIIEKEFAVKEDISQDVNATPAPSSQEIQPQPHKVESQVPGWDCKMVQDWLVANNVTTRHKALKSFNGTQLLQLKKLLATVPQAFYQSVKEDLKVPFPDVLSLAAALENLS